MKYLLILITFFLTSCGEVDFPGMGNADYKIKLTKDFFLTRASSRDISISGKGIRVSTKVTKLAITEQYILVQQTVRESHKKNYFIIDHISVHKNGPYNFEEFKKAKLNFGIDEQVKLKELDEITKTKP